MGRAPRARWVVVAAIALFTAAVMLWPRPPAVERWEFLPTVAESEVPDERRDPLLTSDVDPAATLFDSDVNYNVDSRGEVAIPGAVSPSEVVGIVAPFKLPAPGGLGNKGSGGALEGLVGERHGEAGGFGLRSAPSAGSISGRSGTIREGGATAPGSTLRADARPDGPKSPLPTPPLPSKSDPGVADAVAGTATRTKKPSDPVPPAGILTSGSFDDNLDPLLFASFTKRFDAKRWQDNLPIKLAGTRVQVIVKDAAGKPVGGATVRLSAGQATEQLVTRAFGQVTFVLTWDGLPQDEELQVAVTPPDGSPVVTDKIPASVPRWEVTLPATQARLPKNLDLALIIDTTGSMGDELKYLIGEVKGIAADIKAKFPEVNQRVGLVLYRDAGDEYVTRMFDFTTSLDEFHRNLSKQSANGGGDTPEAVHKGLEQAQQLRWRSDPDTARVAFLIGDAPPHAQYMNATMKAVNILRKNGIAIYPIACSGYDDPCELIWRSTAFLTSSQFLFLTDDSGVGGGHAEPKIPYYQVEHLNKLMVRMVAGELTGERLGPLPGDVIRSVGRKVN